MRVLSRNDFKKLISWWVIDVPQINLRITLDDIWFQAMQEELDKAQDEMCNVNTDATINEANVPDETIEE